MRPASQKPNAEKPTQREAVSTAGEILQDGTIIEIVRVEEQLRLHVWRNGRARIAAQYENAGITYQPLAPDSTLAAIRLPVRSARYGSIRQLFDAILSPLARFSGLPSQDLIAVAYWAIASWVPELLPVVPTLIILSPSPADARKFLRLLRSFCRRGVLLTEVSSSAFLTLPLSIRPTLLLEQTRLDRRMRGLIRATAEGTYVPNGGKLLDLRCARAIACEQEDLDADLREGCMTVSLFPSPGEVPVLDSFAEEQLAGEFQSRLLSFRCQNFESVANSQFDVPGFSTGIRDLARSLGACVVRDPTLEAGVISLLAPKDADLRATLATRPDFAIVVALLTLLHERREIRVSMTRLTAFANAALRANGEIKEYSPLEIGRLCSRSGIPRSRNASGMVIDLTRDVSRRVHDLKRRFGVVTSPASFPGCPDCESTPVSADRQLV